MWLRLTLALLVQTAPTLAACPFGFDRVEGGAHTGGALAELDSQVSAERSLLEAPETASVQGLDWKALEADIKTVLDTSQSFWPADFGNCTTSSCTGGNYGGLIIRYDNDCRASFALSSESLTEPHTCRRLAWHCAGSYRCDQCSCVCHHVWPAMGWGLT